MNKLLAFFQRNLCSDWLPRQVRTGSSCPFGIACYDPAKEKEKLVERITKNPTFGRFLQWSRKKWPNKVKTKKTLMTLVGLLCQSCWLLLTNLVRSRRLGISLVLFGLFMDLDFVSVHKNAKKQTNRQTSSHKGGKFLQKLWSFALTKG